MALVALLLCQDEEMVRVLGRVLSDLDIITERCGESFEAVKRLMDEPFDAVIVDCADEQSANMVLKSARTSPLNKSALAVAIVDAQAGVQCVFKLGASFVLYKPLSVEQAKRSLQAARTLMLKNAAAQKGAAGPKPVSADDYGRSSAVSVPGNWTPSPAGSSLPEIAPLLGAGGPATSKFAGEEPPDLPLRPLPGPEPTPANPMWRPLAAGAESGSAATAAAAVKAAPAGAPLVEPPKPPAVEFERMGESATEAMPLAAEIEHKPVSPQPILSRSAPLPRISTLSSSNYGTRNSILGLETDEPAASGSRMPWLLAILGLLVAGCLAYFVWLPRHNQATAPAQPEESQAEVPAVTPEAQAQPAPAGTPQPLSKPLAGQPHAAVPAPAAAEPAHGSDDSGSADNVNNTTPEPVAPIRVPSKVPTNGVGAEVRTPAPSGILAKIPGAMPANDNAGLIGGIVSTAPAAVPKLAVPAPVVPDATSTQPLKVSQRSLQGLLIREVKPDYPLLARQAHVQGIVVLQAVIGKDGSVVEVQRVSGNSMLAPAAIRAVQQWRYKPYLLDGRPVSVQTEVTINFVLPQ